MTTFVIGVIIGNLLLGHHGDEQTPTDAPGTPGGLGEGGPKELSRVHTQVLPLLIALLAVWGLGLLLSSTRNRRFVVAASAWSLIWVAANLTSGSPEPTVLAVLLLLAGIPLAWPEPFGLSSIRRNEQWIDTALKEQLPLLGDPQGYMQAAKALAGLDVSLPRDGYWHLAVHLLQRSADRDPSSATVASSTPRRAYARAGREYWKVALWQHVIGSRVRPSIFDEDIALRSYQDEFARLVPASFANDQPLVALPSWAQPARNLVGEVKHIPLQHPVARRARNGLVAAMEAYLELADGDRSASAVDRQREAAQRMEECWDELTAAQSPVRQSMQGPAG